LFRVDKEILKSLAAKKKLVKSNKRIIWKISVLNIFHKN